MTSKQARQRPRPPIDLPTAQMRLTVRGTATGVAAAPLTVTASVRLVPGDTRP